MKTILRISTVDLTTKLLELRGGNYLIVIARGTIDLEALEQIFREISATIKSLLDCKILIDLADALIGLELPDIEIVNRLGHDLLRRENKIAVVSSAEIEEFGRLSALSASLCSLGFRVAAFDNAKSAVVWLADVN